MPDPASDGATDPFREHVGVDLVDASPESATARMMLADEHLNLHGTPHGGALYTLADAAFAAASNAGPAAAVALETSMSYLETRDVGETLTATATRVHDSARTALYEVDVTGEDDALLAEFRGRVYKVDAGE